MIKEAVLIETPIWKKVNNSNLFFTGHIDLLMIKNDTIYVCDYKQDVYEIYKSLPQIATYGIMLRDMLKNYGNVNMFKIRGLNFCENYAIEFNPKIIQREIQDFAHLWHRTTGTRIRVKGTTRRLMDDIEKLISVKV